MIQSANVDEKLYEYDPIYDTRTNYVFGCWRIGLLGIPLILLGIVLAGLCIADMNDGAYRSSNLFGNRVIAWSENPWWPTYAKGVWVGLMLITLGVLGIIAHYEETHTAIKVFGYGCLIAALFLFYLIISTIKEIQFGQLSLTFQVFNSFRLYNTYALNAAMCALAVLAFFIALIAGILSLCLVDCEDDYYLEPYYGPM
ncbi:unnamed protein product [Brachionus calyciflorus]|uniref:Uncharacterized protein n=1 Tax=Brachionus calyciflorus TaxID=104777 RepID=A0A813MPM1_9BILA|nr:unnamed protein product [Brachionus calyciflorus]